MRIVKGFVFAVGLLCVIVGTVGVVWVVDASGMRNENSSSAEFDFTKSVDASGIRALQIDTDISEVVFTPSQTNEITAHFTGKSPEKSKSRWQLDAETNNGTWVVKAQHEGSDFNFGLDIRQLRDIIATGIFTSNHKLEISLPPKAYDKIAVETDTGRIQLGELTADVLDVDSSTGSIAVDSFTGKKITLQTDTGAIRFNKTVATDQVQAESSTGRIEGDLKQLASPVSLQTDTGAVYLDVPGTSDALFNLSNDTGSIDLNASRDVSYETEEEHHVVAKLGTGAYRVKIESSTGAITVNAR
ncbi:DUF4097 domain-containing protein [Paenibacillus chartarius]|uniref:DUF4097 domain-containing protein n=1 Tax=Paenibacillus chartarius TaxID=747481 RepID=A0ABV6DEP1_9BACL